MGTINVFLLGKFDIESNTDFTHKFEPQKAKELLVYLLLNRSHHQSREQLTDVLWKENAAEQSKNYLRKSLWQVQCFLESCGSQDLLIVDGEWLGINPQFDFNLDIAVLEIAFKSMQGLQGRDLSPEQMKKIEEAVELYRGDLLDGWYQDWCLYERERLQHLYLTLLDKLMDYCEAHGSYEDGLVFGERVLQYDRARERTHRRLMRIHYWAGDRTAALRQYRKCVVVLNEELGVEPAHRTRTLYELICADKLDSLPQSPSLLDTRVGKKEKDSLMAVFRHLKNLHRELSQMQNQLAKDMHVIQNTLQRDRS